MNSTLVRNQKKVYGPRPISGWGHGAMIRATVRHDDECGNGHNSFSITGEIFIPGKRDVEACGCIHDEVSKHFPELAPFIKWHLTSTDGPMHYIANTLYHASDKDSDGLRKGEIRQIRNGKTGQLAWKKALIDDNGNEIEDSAIPKYVDSDTQPDAPSARLVYLPWTRIGEGKAREFDSARSSAVWPEATDEELMSPNLKEKLETRLPELLKEFQAAVESLGLTY